jgi:carbon starvation protein CstA
MAMNRKLVAVVNIVHVLSLALWGGSTMFFSFVVAPRVFGFLHERLPVAPPAGVQGLTLEVGRRLAGDTVGVIFPTYFGTQIVAGCLAVATGVMLIRSGKQRAKLRTTVAALALLIVTVHAFTVYPRSIQVLESHYRFQEQGKDAEATELRKQFGMWHGLSQTLNLLVILLVLISLISLGVPDTQPD